MRSQALTRRRLGIIIAVAVAVVDQITKAWAVRALGDGPIEIVGETVRFRLTYNPGAAFSSFTGGGPVLGIIAIGVALGILLLLPSVEHRSDLVGLGLVLGGAVGNFIDRIVQGDGILDGAVVDFIDVGWWPTFNVADSAITIGVIVLLLGVFRHE